MIGALACSQPHFATAAVAPAETAAAAAVAKHGSLQHYSVEASAETAAAAVTGQARWQGYLVE